MRHMRSVVLALVAAAATTTSAVAASGAPAPTPPTGVVPGSYIVTLKAGNPDVIAREHAQRESATVDHVYRYALHGYSARMSAAGSRHATEPR